MNKIIEENRMGRFLIPEDFYKAEIGSWKNLLLKKIFALIYPIRMRKHFDNFEFVAYSEIFHTVKEGALIPNYWLIINKGMSINATEQSV